jgi:hypothetical protein
LLAIRSKLKKRGRRMIMSSRAEQYRCYGEKVLASAKQTTCEQEMAELLEIAGAWFKLAGEQGDMADIPQSTSIISDS